MELTKRELFSAMALMKLVEVYPHKQEREVAVLAIRYGLAMEAAIEAMETENAGK